MGDGGFRRYIGGGRYQPPNLGMVDYCADHITPRAGSEGGGRPMFEWLACADESGRDAMTTATEASP
jgi:hypothetical protein